MNGKVLDVVLIVVLAVVFFGFAIFHPGLGNAVVAWVGLVGLGYYNSFVRHDPALERETPDPGRPLDHHQTLRPGWR
ncbi:hypothetical protein ACWEO2_22250 [Nocardia sp. NPDC004278]